MNRHIASLAVILAVSEQLVHEVGKGEATLLEDASLSVLAEDNVFGEES